MVRMAVRRGRGEALGLAELATLRERAADIREAPALGSHVDLAHRPMRRGEVHERPVANVVAADRLLAAHDQLRVGRPVVGHGVEMDVAAVLDREEEPAAVPERLAMIRIRRALPVERSRQQRGVASVRVHHAEVGVMRVGPVLDRHAVRDPAPVGRERRPLVGAFVIGQSLRLAAVDIHHVEAVDQSRVPVLVAQPVEDELLSVR